MSEWLVFYALSFSRQLQPPPPPSLPPGTTAASCSRWRRRRPSRYSCHSSRTTSATLSARRTPFSSRSSACTRSVLRGGGGGRKRPLTSSLCSRSSGRRAGDLSSLTVQSSFDDFLDSNSSQDRREVRCEGLPLRTPRECGEIYEKEKERWKNGQRRQPRRRRR